MNRSEPKRPLFLVLTLLAYATLGLVLVYFHEPWRDEADAWIVAREDSLFEIFRLMGYAGTPSLWYIVQYPFAKLGFPYVTQGLLHLAIACASAWLLLFKAPLPRLIRILLLFGYYLGYEYSIVARNYNLSVLLLFSLCAMRPNRLMQPGRYGLLAALLANTNVHSLAAACAVTAEHAYDLLRARGVRTALAGTALPMLGILASVLQLLPPADGQIPLGVGEVHLNWLELAISHALIPVMGGATLAVYVTLPALALAVATLIPSRRGMFFLAVSYGGLFSIFVFKYFSGTRHAGLILVLLISALWMARSEEPTPSRASAFRAPAPFAALFASVILLPFLAYSCLQASRTWRDEIRSAYSDAEDMAHYLIRNGLQNHPIIAHKAPPCSAVIPYLPRGTRFWYPGISDYGHHMKWDRAYVEGINTDLDHAMNRVADRFPSEPDARKHLLLLLNEPLRDPTAYGLNLLHHTPGRIFMHADERFFLYGAP